MIKFTHIMMSTNLFQILPFFRAGQNFLDPPHFCDTYGTCIVKTSGVRSKIRHMYGVCNKSRHVTDNTHILRTFFSLLCIFRQNWSVEFCLLIRANQPVIRGCYDFSAVVPLRASKIACPYASQKLFSSRFLEIAWAEGRVARSEGRETPSGVCTFSVQWLQIRTEYAQTPDNGGILCILRTDLKPLYGKCAYSG